VASDIFVSRNFFLFCRKKKKWENLKC